MLLMRALLMRRTRRATREGAAQARVRAMPRYIYAMLPPCRHAVAMLATLRRCSCRMLPITLPPLCMPLR